MIIVTVSTIPFASLGATTSYTFLAPLLVLRGIGIGCAMMPAMAAAYATLDARGRAARDERAERAAARRRLGRHRAARRRPAAPDRHAAHAGGRRGGGRAPGAGSSQRVPEDVRQEIAEPVATAFGNTFWWAVGMSAVAIIPTAILAISQGRERRARVLAEARSPVA